MSIPKPEWRNHPALVDFFLSARHRAEELYPSERRFLPWLASQGTSVLDVGCAAGGFASIWRHFRPEMAYTGVDFSELLIEAARADYPADQFFVGNCAEGLPVGSNAFELVQALGWLQWEPRFEDAIRELWRATSRYCFFDVRLRGGGLPMLPGRQKIAYGREWDGTSVPYIVFEWAVFARFLETLQPSQIFGLGYWGRPADTVMGIDEQICFSTFVLDKQPAAAGDRMVCIDSPLAWPDLGEERPRRVRPASDLRELCPVMG